ncbi:hypothetical protein ISF_09889 [Cordyceps fumosorosea ARSEF 2679]|uniref:Uncharacterized protein n=1 Tax=Cordyceps fumosorosea (strain ARSEF 2679) TaxID=1081104 RepID=A0A167A427_CORFA|nr:hypothetical protein ISF_09889 [Cordyceps fumosorosea ARSEF 2679]OAA38531.1 hypothetical protein ISF_09889 [Cordyceps fumosorosea ARSEF 2679]
MAKLQLWIGIGKRRGNDPRHWILILVAPDATESTWYHVTGGPTTSTEYKLVIQNKRFKSFGIAEHHFVGEIDEKDVRKLKSSAQGVPVQMCQEWAVAVLQDLERKGLLTAGTAQHWSTQVESSQSSSTGHHGIVNPAESSSSGIQWVWDAAQQAYRYWDEKSRRWVWQNETTQ